jgi:hypothetical protein
MPAWNVWTLLHAPRALLLLALIGLSIQDESYPTAQSPLFFTYLGLSAGKFFSTSEGKGVGAYMGASRVGRKFSVIPPARSGYFKNQRPQANPHNHTDANKTRYRKHNGAEFL